MSTPDDGGAEQTASERRRAMSAAERRAALLALVRVVVITAALLLVYAAIPLSVAEEARWAPLAVGLLVLALVLVWQVLQVTKSAFPRLRAVEALATSVPLFLVLFAASYVAMAAQDPDAFTQPLDRVDAVYFTVTIFATVGFGDIAAVTQAARIVVTIQMLGGLVLVGLIARLLVGAVEIGLKRRDDAPPAA